MAKKEVVYDKIMANDLTDYERSLMTRHPRARTRVPDCPKCGSDNTIRNGYKDKKQRFQCNECHKTYGETDGTIFYKSWVRLSEWRKLYKEIHKEEGGHKNGG